MGVMVGEGAVVALRVGVGDDVGVAEVEAVGVAVRDDVAVPVAVDDAVDVAVLGG